MECLQIGDELNLRHFHCSRDPTSLHDHRDVHKPSMNCTCGNSKHLSFTTTGMSTLSENCNSGTPQFSARLDNLTTLSKNWRPQHLSLHTTGVSNLSKKCTCGISTGTPSTCGTSTVFCTVTTRQQSLNNNGCHQLVQELHLWDVVGLLNSNTVGTTSPTHNREVEHSVDYPNAVDELNLGHLREHVRLDCWNLSLKITGTSTTEELPRRCNSNANRRSPRSALPLPLHHLGTPLWGSRAPPQTDVIMTVVSLLTRLGSPRGRGSFCPEGWRHSTVWPSGQLLRWECHPSSHRLAAPADFLAAS